MEYAHTHTHTHTYIHTHIHTYTYTLRHVHTYAPICLSCVQQQASPPFPLIKIVAIFQNRWVLLHVTHTHLHTRANFHTEISTHVHVAIFRSRWVLLHVTHTHLHTHTHTLALTPDDRCPLGSALLRELCQCLQQHTPLHTHTHTYMQTHNTHTNMCTPF